MSRALVDLLTDLRAGQQVILARDPEFGVEHAISFENGAWYEERLNCHTGGCACFSHDRYAVERIDRAQALSLLRRVVAADRKDEIARAAEVAWLDTQLAELRAGLS